MPDCVSTLVCLPRGSALSGRLIRELLFSLFFLAGTCGGSAHAGRVSDALLLFAVNGAASAAQRVNAEADEDSGDESEAADDADDEEEAEPEEEDDSGTEDDAKAAPGAKAAGKAEAGPARDAKGGAAATASAEPPFERLLEFNSSALFGGKAKVTGDQVVVTFDADGDMVAGFEGKGIIDSKNETMKGKNRDFIIIDKPKDGPEVLVPGLCALGLGDGTWTSKFPLAGETWVEFGMRVPNLIAATSNIRVRVNWDKDSGYETNFFKSVAYLSSGTVKASQPTTLPEYKGPASDWFPRKNRASVLRVGFGFRNGKCVSQINSKETASLAKAFDKGGRVSFRFSKLTFTIDNLKVSGKLDRKWAEKRIEELKASGALLRAAPPPKDPAAKAQ